MIRRNIIYLMGYSEKDGTAQIEEDCKDVSYTANLGEVGFVPPSTFYCKIWQNRDGA